MTLRQQAFQKLKSMLDAGMGRSRHQDKKDGTDKYYIYSFKTFNTYRQTMEYFIRWLEVNHPEVTTLKKARKYVREWLVSLEGKYKASTIQTRAKGIGKFYGITSTDPDYYEPPVRHREDIVKNRQRTKTDAHFSEAKHADLIHFADHCGFRREGMESITRDSLYDKQLLISEIERINKIPISDRSENDIILLDCYKRTILFRDCFDFFILVREKGGKWRLAPIIGSKEDVRKIVAKFESTAPGHSVWGKLSKNYNEHRHRAEYAAALYRQFARPIDQIPYDSVNKASGHRYQSEVYVCRTDLKGKRFDKKAMEIVEKALGHESPHTFASHYAYKL